MPQSIAEQEIRQLINDRVEQNGSANTTEIVSAFLERHPLPEVISERDLWVDVVRVFVERVFWSYEPTDNFAEHADELSRYLRDRRGSDDRG